jgi:hypothetical protein
MFFKPDAGFVFFGRISGARHSAQAGAFARGFAMPAVIVCRAVPRLFVITPPRGRFRLARRKPGFPGFRSAPFPSGTLKTLRVCAPLQSLALLNSSVPRRSRPSKAGLALTGGSRFYCAPGVCYILLSTPLNGAPLLRSLARFGCQAHGRQNSKPGPLGNPAGSRI